MIQIFHGIHPVVQALLATLFTWGLTAFGASLVFFTFSVGKKFLDAMLGFSAGVMIAASYWSLLAPAIEMSADANVPSWLPAAAGFLLGGIFLGGVDRLLPHLHLSAPDDAAEGLKSTWERSVLLVSAITLHNFPEGLAVGVAFGAAAAGNPEASIAGALVLALGIGIQNFPEGMAVSLPLRREGMSTLKSFLYGQASAMVEPVAGVLGAAAVIFVRPILPYALSFAAGAMIYVVVEELIPESERENPDLATMSALVGFTIMMILDIAFG